MWFSPKIKYAVVALSGALVLSACTPPQPEPNELTFSDSESYSLETDIEGNNINYQQNNGGSLMPNKALKNLEDFEQIVASQVVLTTTKGEVVIELFTEQAPLTTTNFLNLVKSGYYDGIVIHRVVPDFVVQFGDPLTKEAGTEAGWGTGGPGYAIADEFHPELKHDGAGILSMANSGPNTGGSQVFITLEATPWLDGKHAVFGRVTSGMDVVTQLSQGDQITQAVYR